MTDWREAAETAESAGRETVHSKDTACLSSIRLLEVGACASLIRLAAFLMWEVDLPCRTGQPLRGRAHFSSWGAQGGPSQQPQEPQILYMHFIFLYVSQGSLYEWEKRLCTKHTFLKIEVELIYNVVLVSSVQQSDSVIHTYIYVCVCVCVCVCVYIYSFSDSFAL